MENPTFVTYAVTWNQNFIMVNDDDGLNQTIRVNIETKHV